MWILRHLLEELKNYVLVTIIHYTAVDADDALDSYFQSAFEVFRFRLHGFLHRGG
jgi:hypothetical protein